MSKEIDFEFIQTDVKNSYESMKNILTDIVSLPDVVKDIDTYKNFEIILFSESLTEKQKIEVINLVRKHLISNLQALKTKSANALLKIDLGAK